MTIENWFQVICIELIIFPISPIRIVIRSLLKNNEILIYLHWVDNFIASIIIWWWMSNVVIFHIVF